jgi:hypothetical protein
MRPLTGLVCTHTMLSSMLSRTCLLVALAVLVVSFPAVSTQPETATRAVDVNSPYIPHCCPRLGCDNGNTNANSALKGPITAPSGTIFVTTISIGSDTSSELVRALVPLMSVNSDACASVAFCRALSIARLVPQFQFHPSVNGTPVVHKSDSGGVSIRVFDASSLRATAACCISTFVRDFTELTFAFATMCTRPWQVFGPNGDFYISTEKSLLKHDGVRGEEKFNLIKPERSTSAFQPSTVQDAPVLLVSQPLVAALNSEVRGLDADTADTLWMFNGTAFTGCASSKKVLTTILGVLSDGTVVVSAICLRSNTYSPAFVVQLDAADGTILSSFAKNDEAGYLAFASTLHERDDGENFTVFYVDLDGEVALDGHTGDVLWKGRGGCNMPQAAQLLPLALARGSFHDKPVVDDTALCVLNSYQTVIPLGSNTGKAAWSKYPTYQLKMAASRHGFSAVVGPSSLSLINSTDGATLASVTRPGDGGTTVPAVDDAALAVYDATFTGALSDKGEMTVCLQRYTISQAPNSTHDDRVPEPLKLTLSWARDGVCQKIKGPSPQFQQYSMQMWVSIAPSEGVYVKARTWRRGSGAYTNHVILFR